MLDNVTKQSFTNWISHYWWSFPLITFTLSISSIFLIDWNAVVGLIICALSAIALLLQVPVFIILLAKKKWWRAVGAFFAGIVCLVTFVTIPLLLIGMFFDSMPDKFGKEHPIPEGLEYSIPITDSVCKLNATDGAMFTPVSIDSTDTTSWLQIWNGSQEGIYNFAFYWPALEDGEVYLRCFEVTENIELSKKSVKSRTTTQVVNHYSFGQIVEPNHKRFAIHEGDWDDYYAVRVEVWHNPIHGKPHKLMEKIYRMEGWTR